MKRGQDPARNGFLVLESAHQLVDVEGIGAFLVDLVERYEQGDEVRVE